MIQVSNLEKSYGKQVLFDNVSFTIAPGERIGLVGRNGHGKSTFFRMLIGEDQPDSGIINIPDHYTIGHLSQHLRFTEKTVLKEACLGLKPNEYGIDETYKVETVLHGLGFSVADLELDPKDLSGGYQVRLSLAKVLVSEPNLLLLDEPTNYLDIVSIRWIKKFLSNWKNELILITHDRSFMDTVITHTMAIHRCKVRKMVGSTDKLYQQILLEEEIHEQTRVNEAKKRKVTEDFINRFRAKATKAKAVQSRVKALEKKGTLEKLTHIKNLDFQFKSAPFNGKRLLEVQNLSFSYDKETKPLIEDFSIAVGKHDRIAIMGQNGRGKTTLLSMLAGELAPQSGNISAHPAMKPAYFGQANIERLNPELTVEEEVSSVHPEHQRTSVRSICGLMMFSGDDALKKIDVLSGGEKSRVLLAKLLVSPANLLMLDEPTNHLDMESVDSLTEAIDDFEGAVIIVTHNEMLLHAIATRLIVFDAGKVTLFEGTYQDFLDRVGWSDEGEIALSDVKSDVAPTKQINKKEMRRLRAELVTERSKATAEMKKRIAEIESSITQLEKKAADESRELIDVSHKGDRDSIRRLSKSIDDTKGKIEVLFIELDELTARHEKRLKEFEDRLNELS